MYDGQDIGKHTEHVHKRLRASSTFRDLKNRLGRSLPENITYFNNRTGYTILRKRRV